LEVTTDNLIIVDTVTPSFEKPHQFISLSVHQFISEIAHPYNSKEQSWAWMNLRYQYIG